MPHPKDWPESQSEYVMPASAVNAISAHLHSGQSGPPFVIEAANAHNAAVWALAELRRVAETYYEAAGFRE